MKAFSPILFVLTCLLSSASFAQDSLRFKDGNTVAVKILQVDAGTEILKYEEGGITKIVASSALSAYFIQGVWIESNPTLNTPDPSQEIRYGFFTKPMPFERGKWSVSFNLLSALIPNTGERRYHWDFMKERHFSSRPSLNVSAEYVVNNKLSLKIPVFYGFKGNDIPEDLSSTSNDYGQFLNTRRVNSGTATSTPDYEFYYLSYWGYPHGNNMLFQIGVYPKIYPLGNSQMAWFVSPGLNYGTADFLAVDYYQTFSLTQANNNFYWDGKEQVMEIHTNNFNYMRFELLTGLDMNFSKNLSCSFEVGAGSKLKNKGSLEDRLFVRPEGGEYKFMDSEKFRYDGYTIMNWAMRFHLTYHI